MSGNAEVGTVSAYTFGTLVAWSWMGLVGLNLVWPIRLGSERFCLEDLPTRTLADERSIGFQDKCSGASLCVVASTML